MKLIKQSYEILPQGHTLEEVYKHIERVARTCYKSEDKITDNSAHPFVERLIEARHTAMLEHGTIYLAIPERVYCEWSKQRLSRYADNNYSRSLFRMVDGEMTLLVTTNLRVIIENAWQDDLQYITEPTEHERRVTVKFITDQGIMREFTRHRVFSFAVESTRFCNYSKDKFGNEITFIHPCWMSEKYTPEGQVFMRACEEAESWYFDLLRRGWTPEKARNVLPLATKCEMVMTGFTSDWKGFFSLRAYGSTGKPHPQAAELAIPLLNDFIELAL